jgi:Ca2+-binding RTX toxin-like protein
VAVFYLPCGGAGAQGTDSTCFGRPATIVGTDGDDEILGTAGPDVIVSLDGDDSIQAGPGADYVCAGPGRDDLVGGSGNDVLSGDTGPDGLVGNRGHDVGHGGGGDDHWGDSEPRTIGHDRFFGGSGDDFARGELGRDAFFGGQGVDSLAGGRGDDRLGGGADAGDVLLGFLGNDALDGGAGGSDVASYADHLEALECRAAPRSVFVDLAAHRASGGYGVDTLRRIEGAIGGNGDDVMLGDAGPNLFEQLGGGSDTMHGRGGRDTIAARNEGFCVSGSNSLVVNLALGTARYRTNFQSSVRLRSIENARGSDEDADRLFGDSRGNRLVGRGGNDEIIGGAGNDRLIGDVLFPLTRFPGEDQLRGGAGDDTLYGNEADDDLDGGTGINMNSGGSGVDRCVNPSDPPDAIECELT